MPNGTIAHERQVLCEPLQPLHVFRDFTPDERAFVGEFKSGEMNAEPGTTLLREGAGSENLYTLLSGWAFRFKSLPDGRRQILDFALPGAFLGLQAATLGVMHHSVEILTPARLCVFPVEKLKGLYKTQPGIAFDITRLAAREGQLVDEQLLNVGHRSAVERMAFLILHLYRRAVDAGVARGNKLILPFTQQHMADTLGMSLVHANKTLRRLADTKVLRWTEKTFEILDMDRMGQLALYDVSDKGPRLLI